MKSKFKLRKDFEYEPKSKEEYFKLFEDYSLEFAYEPFPHHPFYRRWYREEDVLDPKKEIFDVTYKDSFFPFKEELEVGELEFKKKGYSEYIYKSESAGDGGLILVSSECFPLHYSHDRRVWDWDWERTREYNFGNTQLDIYYTHEEAAFPRALEIFRKNKVQSKIVERFGEGNGKELLVRINKNNYYKFRESLLELSKSYNIYSQYDYNELRNIIRDYSATIFA